MQLTKQAISNNKDKIPGIDGYSVVIGEIDKNVNIHPDIAIESCKSLIEGLCKKALVLLSENYNSDRGIRKQCDNKLEVLVKTAFNEVFKDQFELELFSSLYLLIKKYEVKEKLKIRIEGILEKNSSEMLNQIEKAILKISKIRDRRGDISHGRIYPKNEESELHLAKAIFSITDGICSFMIEEIAFQYVDKMSNSDKLIYSTKEEFNNWLDDTYNIHSVKIDYSKLLFKNVYDKYEELFYGDYQEYLDSIKSEEELNKEGRIEIISGIEEKQPSSSIINLVNDFDENNFWTDKRKEGLAVIALTNYFTVEGLGKLISDYLSDERLPLRDDIRKVYRAKMNLQEMKTALPELEKKIVEWAQIIKGIK